MSYPSYYFFRSSHPEVFYEKGTLTNSAKLIGKRMCQGLFFNKVVGLRPAALLKETLAHLLSCEFCEFCKKTYFIEKTCRGGSTNAATSKMKHFVITVNGRKPLTIITSSILDVATALDPPLTWVLLLFFFTIPICLLFSGILVQTV